MIYLLKLGGLYRYLRLPGVWYGDRFWRDGQTWAIPPLKGYAIPVQILNFPASDTPKNCNASLLCNRGVSGKRWDLPNLLMSLAWTSSFQDCAHIMYFIYMIILYICLHITNKIIFCVSTSWVLEKIRQPGITRVSKIGPWSDRWSRIISD
jgi:hypothetical protein